MGDYIFISGANILSLTIRRHSMTISVDMSEAEKKDAMNMYRSRNVRGALLSHLSVPCHTDTRPIQNSNDHTMIDVEFHILSSLPRDDPIIVKREWETS